MEAFVDCLICNRKWKFASEQAVCVDLYGACIVCLKEVLMGDEVSRICRMAKKRGAYDSGCAATEGEYNV